ncbi:uncharacterized protein TRAVEDRAFT_116512 [Trametes versicolor FP-101664 SS1]|uniref:uncharacterized protein n=1 Tax=Trametes versicolor (strain FP-101664) TaxID=717944 RepID=UPI000462196C|nr:uncharacterized protein TRAVEDRAFT_116512 [Trametes versicolor FP-101664 SS1]EIW62090.1 hypothetical protein TRAVEDRAFT_116512 [Trametes versicolor FP-101664 SS1]
MSVARALQLNHRQRRTFISSLFGLTFLATVLTVSASTILPCPVDRGRYADAHGGANAALNGGRRDVLVEKRPRRWIEETRPASRAPPSNAQP